MRSLGKFRCLFAAVGVVAGLLASSAPAAADTFSDSGFATERIATVPPFTLVGMAFAPDGRMFVWQKNGIVRVIKNGQLLPTPFIDLSAKVNTFDDRGFWGLAFDPQFASNGRVYMSYTYENAGNPNSSAPRTGRLVRVTADPANPDVALPGSEQVILGSVGTPPCSAQPANADCIGSDGGSHTVGSLHFASDGTLFVGVGDGSDGDANSMRAQDLNSPNGKILRINTDGTAPSDNPFYDGTNSWRSRVWAYGMRNPFGYAVQPETDEIYMGDVGWNTWEEVNHGPVGSNFGWPCYEGNDPQPFFQSSFPGQCALIGPVTPPLYTYSHASGTGSAVIGGPFYTGTAYPPQYRDEYFFADYTGNFIKRVVFDSDHHPVSVQSFATNVESPVSLALGPDGMIYYLSFTTGEIRRIRYAGPVAKAAATPTNGYSPLSVSFSSAGSVGTGTGALSYLWDFGDGATSTAANPSHTYSSSTTRTFTARLTVTQGGVSSTDTVDVTVGSAPPTPTILAPTDGTSVVPGDTITYRGSATDPDDGPLGPSALKWTILLHHNAHVHTFVGGSGDQGSFVAEDHGDIGTFSYEVILTATDSSGLKSSTSVHLPVAADTTPPSDPSALNATAASSSRIDLNWPASTDNAAVADYRVERCQGAACTNFAEIATPAATAYSDAGLVPQTTYRYRVRARDPSNNFSGYSPIATATTAAGPATPPGLVGAWAFDEGFGASTADASGKGNTGTVNGATWSNQGRYGNALSFNGLNSTVRVADSSSLDLSAAMTLSAWIRPTASQSGWRTIMQRERDAYFLNASNSTGALRPAGGATFGANTQFISGPTASPVDAWTYVALTYDGATLKLYVNGTQVATTAITGAIQATDDPLSIGGNSPYGEFFQGLIDEVRVYDRALTQADVQADMNAPIAPAAPDTTPPTDPTALNATTVGPNRIDLNWPASTDNVGVSDYRVERCQGAGCTDFAEVATPTATAYSDTPLTAATTYRYRVRARDQSNNFSGYSTIATATTTAPDTTPPSDPSALNATAASSSRIDLNWPASTDNAAVADYRVERCQGAACTNFAEIATPAATAYSDAGLVPQTTYRYRVRARDPSNNFSGYSPIATATTAAGPATPPGLVGAWAFDEGFGASTADASGKGNTGTVNGATWSNQGRYGNALSFNGLNSTVRVADSSSLDLSAAMTLSAWIRPTASQSGWRTIMQRERDAYFLNASNSTGALRPAGGATFGANTQFISGPTASPVDAWTYVALTYDGATLKLYVNGTQVATTAITGAIQATDDPLSIGGNSPYGEFFQGLIDEVRVYDRALTQADVQADMNAPIAPAAPDTTPPTDPTALNATTVGPNRIDLNWPASTDNVGVSDYRVERCQGAGCTDFAEVATPTATAYSDTTPTAATTYRYRVRARDQSNNFSGYSTIATATTTAPDTTPPSDPSALNATAASSSRIDLNWPASTDNAAVADYRVERCQGAACTNFAEIATPAATAYSDAGLVPQTTYRYRVRARDPSNNFSGYSPIATATTAAAADTTAPSAPTGLASTVLSSSRIDLNWNTSTDNVGVTGYRVERCQGSGCTNFTQVGTATTTNFSNTGLLANTLYRFRVRAVDAAGNLSPFSTVVNGRTQAADTTRPTAPTGLTTAAAGPNRIDLNWTASTDNVGVTGYRVERCQGAGCTNFAEVATPTATNYGDTGLSASTTYRYRVRAGDQAGNLSTYSSIVTATTPAAPDTTPPSGPTALTATAAGSGLVNLSWPASTDNVAVTDYRVERCQGAACTNFAEIATPTATSYGDTGVLPSTTYRYRVRARDQSNNFSGYSPIATATTPAAPVTPPGLVGAWAFDEGAGTSAADSSGKGNTGTVNGATWTNQGRYGNALSFNGTSNTVRVADSASLDLSAAMTLSAWIRPTASQSGWRTIMQREADAYFLNASNSTGALRPAGGATFGTSTQFISGPTASPVNAWTHVALTYNGGSVRLFVNGTQVAIRAQTGNIQATDNPLWIGGNSPYGEYFQGLIDEVRVYSRALSQADIAADMNAAIPHP